MKKMICLLAACLLAAAMSLNVFADNRVQSMIDELPTVEAFQTMDADARLDAYNRTQAAYDAYMALSGAERAEISGAEEIFEDLFGYFNSQIMPIEEEMEQARPEVEKDRRETLLSGAAVLAVVIVILRILNRKKQ